MHIIPWHSAEQLAVYVIDGAHVLSETGPVDKKTDSTSCVDT